MTNIISIQSTVLNDLVGNQAARYVLSTKRYKFYEIPTIVLTSHKAHKNSLQLNKKNLNCKVITILGHDTYINKEIKYLLDAALNAENNKNLLYFGPLYKNYKGKTDELWQDELYYKN